jgi:hypothetical protein
VLDLGRCGPLRTLAFSGPRGLPIKQVFYLPAAAFLTASNLFKGESDGFFAALTEAADAVG